MYSSCRFRILLALLVLLSLPNLSCGDSSDDSGGPWIIPISEAVGERFSRTVSGIWREDETVHPGSQPDMQLVVESEDQIRLIYERDGQVIEEIYEVESRRNESMPCF
jgi:hypothetical protein